ncbi:MAG: LamG domain-containing protein [Verrucomicrobiota bacterium]|jgi:hypothetical protein
MSLTHKQFFLTRAALRANFLSVLLLLGWLRGHSLGGSGPVGWWRFDDGSGAVARDASGNGFNGRLYGGATWAAGVAGGALRLDGSGYVEVPPAARLQLGSALTIAAWINPTDTSPNTYKNIVELYDSYLLRLDNPPEGGRLSFFTFLNGTPEPRLSCSPPALQQWHQIFATWDGTNLSLWYDGVKRVAPRAGTPAPKPNALHLGQGFVGALGEVKAYDRALSEDEILDQVPPVLVSALSVARPVGGIGQPVGVSCVVSNAGGQPLLNGSVELVLPPSVRLVTGASPLPVASVTRRGAVNLQWQVQADLALATHLQAAVRFPGQPAATNVVGLVIARPMPLGGRLLPQPTLACEGGDLELGNRAVRLVFPTNDFGYGAFAVDVNQSNGWRRLAVANCLSCLAVKSGGAVARQFFHADWWQAITNLPGQAGVEFRRTLTDANGTRWEGRFTFVVSNDERVRASYQVTPDGGADLVLLDGPMLHVGEGTFGGRKEDALFCGLEWLVGDEVSSSNLDMHDPDYYLRFVPHPNKITIPLMAVADGGAALALYWDCLQCWDGQHDRPAAVFASPNFLEGQSNHLLGLFLPSVPDWVPPNQRQASATPYPAAANTPLRLEAWLAAVTPATQSLACVARWFDTFGVPNPAPLPRGNYLGEAQFSMRAFLESLWDAATEKWWTSKGGPKEMSYLAWPAHYLFQLRLGALLTSNAALRNQFNARAALGEQLGGLRPVWDDLGLTWADPAASLAQWRRAATAQVDAMGADGSWRFHARLETNGIFAGRDYGLLGPDGAAEVGTCARNAYEVLRYARVSGDVEAFAAVQKTLEFMEGFSVPRAAQVWECPVHTPDILAAADAVEAYLEAYRFSGNRHYLDQAVRWAWTGVPFVYVWNPPGHPVLRYASIPILGGSWLEGSWLGQPVQWNGLRYAYALLKLADYDSSFPWRKVAEGLTVSALYQQESSGTNVALWPDNFSALNWSKCPWVFEPGSILKNVFKLVGHDVEPTTVIAGPGVRLNARARFSEVSLTNATLRFALQWPPGEAGQVLLSGLNLPTEVRVNGATAPLTSSNLWEVPGAAWRYEAGAAVAVIKLVAAGSNWVEVLGASYRPAGVVWPVARVVDYSFDRSLQGWGDPANIDRLEIANGVLRGHAVNGDPYFHQPRVRLDGNRCRRIAVRARATSGFGLALFWVTEDSRQWGEAKSIHLPFTNRQQFVEYSFEVGQHPLWAGHTIVGLRLDPLEGTTGGDFEIDYIRGDDARLRPRPIR